MTFTSAASPRFAAAFDVRATAPGERHSLILSAFRKLVAGRSMQLVNDQNPNQLYAQVQAEMLGGFTWNYREWGLETSRVQIARLATWWADGQC